MTEPTVDCSNCKTEIKLTESLVAAFGKSDVSRPDPMNRGCQIRRLLV